MAGPHVGAVSSGIELTYPSISSTNVYHQAITTGDKFQCFTSETSESGNA